MILSALVALVASNATLADFPLDDPATGLLWRLDGRSGCDLPSRRPWPGERVLACADSLISDSTLSVDDRSRIEALRSRLDPSQAPWHLLRWVDGERTLGLDVGATAYQRASGERTPAGIDRKDTIDRDVLAGLRVHPRVDVLLGPNIAMWARPEQLVELSPDRRWDKESDAASGTYQTALFAKKGQLSYGRTHDWLEGAIDWNTSLGRGTFGVLPVEWGDLPIEPLLLSGRAAPMPLGQVVQSIGPVEATLLYGQPIGDSWTQDRRIYAHRFAWKSRTWTVGFSEMVVSVERGLQALYLMPVFPYIMTEHVMGDPDNKQMDLDASWRVRPNIELSAELFLDDLQNYLGLFSDAWGNKWGLGLGLKASDLLGKASLDRFQATRMEPWAGTASSAVLPGEPSNAPIHFGAPLGWSAGPNSGALQWIHQQDLSRTWTWSASFSARWKGTDPGSSSLDRNWRDSSGTWVVARDTKAWLSGTVLDRQDAAVGFQVRPGPSWHLDGSLGAIRSWTPAEESWTPSIAAGVSWND